MPKTKPTFVRNLTGHSGCALSLLRNGTMFVRKTSRDKEYNKRLEYQYLKQKVFDKKGIAVPRVLGRGMDKNGLFYFDMEFINCSSMDKHFTVMPMGSVPEMVQRLFVNLPIANSKATDKVGVAVARKLTELKTRSLFQARAFLASFVLLDKYDFSQVPESECHGDLTLENIMISESGKIYLIDLLDSFIDTWMVDVVKILQDVDLHWSYRHTKLDANTELCLLVAKEEIFKTVLAMPKGKKILSDIYHILLLNVLRIFPYAKDNETFVFLENALLKALKQIREIEK
jgi:hypothetical protein